MAGRLADRLGDPAWIMYAAVVVVAVLSVLPGYERWERRQHRANHCCQSPAGERRCAAVGWVGLAARLERSAVAQAVAQSTAA